MRALLLGLGGLLAGLAGGLVVVLGLVVARARIEGAYFHDADELLSWVGLPLLLGPIAGAWIGAAHPPHESILPGSAVGLALGAALGAALGTIGDDPTAVWAGMVMGAASGVVLGVWVPLLRHFRRRRRALEGGWELGPRRPLFFSVLFTASILGGLVVLAAGDAATDPPSAPHLEPEPDSTAVESVLLLLGDAGEARSTSSPILHRVHAEVERWARVIDRDSTVVVVLLGDIVYPAGVRERGSLEWPEDSARVADQAALVDGPTARARGARALFVAGNHDWGERREYEGAVRLHALDELLHSLHRAGLAVDLAPPAGTGGPAIVDVGAHLRLVLLDTAWWLLAADDAPRVPVLRGVSDALASAGDRAVVIGAHHPFASGGPHSGVSVVGRFLGVRELLSRSGALLQDLDSRPYSDLRSGLLRIFAEHGSPALFAGGHEHSIQLLRGLSENEPRRTLVSGSASKLTGVGMVPGVIFARSEPGFARLLVLKDGTLHLTIETAPPEFSICAEGEEAQQIRCMGAGVSAYRVVWSERL
jgi:hypothetical protein